MKEMSATINECQVRYLEMIGTKNQKEYHFPWSNKNSSDIGSSYHSFLGCPFAYTTAQLIAVTVSHYFRRHNNVYIHML